MEEQEIVALEKRIFETIVLAYYSPASNFGFTWPSWMYTEEEVERCRKRVEPMLADSICCHLVLEWPTLRSVMSFEYATNGKFQLTFGTRPFLPFECLNEAERGVGDDSIPKEMALALLEVLESVCHNPPFTPSTWSIDPPSSDSALALLWKSDGMPLPCNPLSNLRLYRTKSKMRRLRLVCASTTVMGKVGRIAMARLMQVWSDKSLEGDEVHIPWIGFVASKRERDIKVLSEDGTVKRVHWTQTKGSLWMTINS